MQTKTLTKIALATSLILNTAIFSLPAALADDSSYIATASSDSPIGLMTIASEETLNQELVPFDSSFTLNDAPEPLQIPAPIQAGRWSIKVIETQAKGHASVLVNNKEVIKFRNGTDSMDASERAHVVAERLSSYLNQPQKALSIKPEVTNKLPVIKIGNMVLATIDNETAAAAGSKPTELANAWTNQLRKALGLEALVFESPLSSPGNSKKYGIPLSTDFFDLSNHSQKGQASWYGGFFHGRRSADGSRFDENRMTAAHRTLPFGSVVKVTNNNNGKSCLVQITDRGPFAHGRIIDVSKGAANALGMIRSGTAHVTIRVMQPRRTSAASKLATRS